MLLSLTASVTQTLPSESISIPWGQINMPPPKESTTLPAGSNFKMGSSSESTHSLPNISCPASQRITAQICRPSRSTFALPTAPITLPPGSFAQPSAIAYGLVEFCATDCCDTKGTIASRTVIDKILLRKDMVHLDCF
ncbi:MAG: hypothetical protein ACJZ79_00800 [Pseudohongiellaceae bacterium]